MGQCICIWKYVNYTKTLHPFLSKYRKVVIKTWPGHFKPTRVTMRRCTACDNIKAFNIAQGPSPVCLFWRIYTFGVYRNGMRAVWQDKAGILIVFLCTSSSVSHYCVQTRGDVYSAETSKSTALGCNLVTSYSLLLPALLTSSLGPATPSAHRPLAPAKCPLSTRNIVLE